MSDLKEMVSFDVDELTEEQAQDARRYVLRHSQSEDDAQYLLEALGL